MQLQSLGAAQTVTGSKHILKTSVGDVLIDCGLFQGLGAKNPAQVPEELSKISAIVLTHGHLDHCGYIPKLVKHGFHGPIFSTLQTGEIAKLIMSDNAKIQAEQNRKKNKKIVKESEKSKPLYDLNDVAQTIPLFEFHQWGETFSWKGLRITLESAGHILGASSVKIEDNDKSIIFSGDLGRYTDPIMPDPKGFSSADAVVMECTYGDRNHDRSHTPESDLINVLKNAKKKSSSILIPAFSVARSQNIMFYLAHIFNKNKDLKVPVYVDSALTLAVTKLYENFNDFHKITKEDFASIHRHMTFIEFESQRERLEKDSGSKIILTASGMLTGGRSPYYLKHLGEDKNNILMIVGYQAEGTLGRKIVDGERVFQDGDDKLKWLGEVYIAKSFSSHADQVELLKWRSQILGLKKTFLVHGEQRSLEQMQNLIGPSAVIVDEQQCYSL
ncbi:MAG: hypothetical protein CME71_02200 [Halobacteriovorax sp.]|nr:hypothetical protein [Halobacteriovorax sp.]|tara:strand:- start:910 stop:2241 length:1332 start_codon:yes stop_codon:yes gene_type:complete